MLFLMNSSKLVTFSYDSKNWEWDIQKIAAMNVSEDVVDFLLEEFHTRIAHS
jgi:hypothetical protein